MKTISKRFLKGGLAILLAITMLFGSCISGIAAVVDNADTKANVDVAGTSATTRYIYVGISNNYQQYKDNNNYGFNFWGGSNGGVKSGTYLNSYTWDGRTYYMYRVSVSDDNNKAQFKGNSNWWDPGDGFSVTLNGTTNNAIFFSHQNDGWQGQFQQNYQETSTGKLTASSTSVSTNTAVTLTPSLNSNATYNQVKSTTYKVDKTGASVSGNTFTATSAGTYTVTATITYNPKYFTGITKTCTATATITVTESKYSYTISAGANGTVTPSGAGSVNQGSSVNITATPNAGYSFDKWTVTNGSVGSTTAASTTFTPTANNATATASFKANTYTVTLNKQNGTGGSSSVTATYNAAMPAITVPTRTGYTFKGYYDAASGGTQYYTSTGASARNWNKTADTTLYAQWTINQYTLSVTQNGGTGTVTLGGTTGTSKTVDYNTPVSVSITPPSGYKIASISGAITSGECASYSGSVTVTENKTITVTYAVAGSCTPQIDNSVMSLKIGETATRTATKNQYCNGSSFTYSSNNTSVATVNSSTGQVTAVTPGTATITVKCTTDNSTATYTVNVATPTITISNATMNVNGTHTINPTVTNANSYTVTYTENSSAFSISNGVISATAPTTATNVTATLKVGTWTTTKTFTVTVNAPTVTITPTEVKLLTGQTMGTAYVTSASYGNPTVAITSGNTSVATISGGKATAKSEGSATITATFTYNSSYKPTATATVLVKDPVITADPTSVALEFGEGATASVTTTTVTLDPNTEDGNGTGDDITVTTDNASVATATVSGTTLTINATGVGSTTVKATFHGTTVEIPVTVTKYDPYAYIYVTDSFNWGTMYIYGWNGSSDVVIPKETPMIYIGRNDQDQRIFAYRILKTDLPEKAIFKKGTDWGYQSTDTVLTDAAVQSYYFDSNTWAMIPWNIDLVRPTVSVADVVVPVAQTATATATVENGGVVYWTTADTNTATVADVTTATATVTGVAVGDTTITARAFIDTAKSSIVELPENYKTQTSCWDYISTEATATVTVGSVDYTVNVNAQYSNDGTNYVDGTTGGTVRATKSAAEGYGELTLPAQISHGKTIEVGATAKSGYRFVGWYKNGNFTSAVSTSTGLATSPITADTTYTARFVKTHQVTVNFTDGIESIKFNNVNYTDSFDNITVDAGASITVYATPEEGYKFTNWTVVGATVADNTAVNLTVSNIQSSITLTANAASLYLAQATAITNGAESTTGGTVTTNGTYFDNGDQITYTAVPTSGYEFIGFYDVADTDYSDPIAFTEPTSRNYKATVTQTANGTHLVAVFARYFFINGAVLNGATEVQLVYNPATDSYQSAPMDVTADSVTLEIHSNYVKYVGLTAGAINCGTLTVDGNGNFTLDIDESSYNTENVVFKLTKSGTTYALTAEAAALEKHNVTFNGSTTEHAVGSTVTLTATPQDGYYLSGVSSAPTISGIIADSDTGKITFTMPANDVTITASYTQYAYINFTDTTGLTITGLKTGYKAGENIIITVAPASEQVTITALTAPGLTVTKDGDNYKITGALTAGQTVTVTPTVDAKFKMDYEMVAIGNYGSGYTTYGTVAMAIGDTALAKGGYVDKTDTVTYTATANTNFIFDGWYSDASCSQGSLLTRNTSYNVTPTKDTTLYALFVPKHYIAEDQANVSSHQEMTYDPATRSFKYSTSTIAKDAWFRVSNNPTTSYWTDSSSYCIFDSSFNVTFNANAYMVTVGWGTQCYALTSDSSAEHPYEIIVALNGNSSIDVSCKAAVDGIGSVFLSSGRGDIVEATSIFTTEGITAVDKNAHQDGTDVSIHESYKVANLQEPQTVSFETELTGENAGNYYIDRYVVYHVNTETYTLIIPNTLGNNKYSGTVYVDGPCYIVPIYHLTPEYTAANGLVEIDIYFDATAIMDKNWGPFVACYAWGSNNTNYAGGWSGQLMIPTEDGSSFYAMIAVPDGVTNTSSVPNGVTFNNYMQATVPGHNAGAFGISATQYQCYDYREPITLYEEGYDVITFVAKESTDGYHGDRANGVTVNTVTTGTTDIFNKYDFDYLYNRNGDVPMDLNGDDIENPVDISEARADYYIIAKGDITYDPNGTKYVADNQFDADWAVDWYVFDSNGTYITHILSDAMYNKYADDGTTYLENALGLTAAQAAGKTIAISYDHENNAGHQISYDGQWYGNMLDDTIIASAVVGIIDENGEITIDNVDPNNEADYGEGWIVANEELDGIIVGDKYARLPITLDYGAVDLSATLKDGYRFVGWYTYSNDKYTKITAAADYNTYISNDTTYYAIFKEIGEDEVIINHLVYNNPDDPFIPSHGGVSEMLVEVYDSQGNLVNTGSTPSTSISTAAFVPVDNEEYTIRIKTTPLMNGTFFAWYTDSDTVDGTKTYEEILVDDTMIGSETMVQSEFTYVYDVLDPVKVINIYSDVTRVSNYANIFYKYLNRFGEWRTITVRDVPLTDDECMGYAGNGYIPYVPTYITQTIEVDGATKSYNSVQEHAPNAEVTEVFDGVVVWRVEEQYLTPTASNVTVVAYQDTPNYTLTYELADGTIDSVTGKYNTLAEISAPAKDGNGNKFSYWIDTESKDIISYKTNYNYRLVDDRHIVAVYGVTAPEWSLIIENVVKTREYQDKSDYVYTDYLIAYHSKQNIRLDEDPADIRYGLIVLRDNNYVDASYPSQNYADQALLESRVKKVAEKATNMRDSANNTLFYHYDLTDKNITNFNRINYYLQYDNNFTEEVNGKTVYLRDYSYSAYAYLVDADGEIFISKVSDVNFYDEATASVNQ